MKKLFGCIKKWSKHLLLLLIAFLLLPPLIVGIKHRLEFSDKDPGRGAATVAQDSFGDSFNKVVYLQQNWKPEDSLWFYNTTQGSDLLPYDFFMVLEQPGKAAPFRDKEYMNRFRYLPQKATSSNPDGLPLGFVKDRYKGKNYVGYTCAACHTAQINYKGVGMRIDGGPAMADMTGFLQNFSLAMADVKDKPEVRQRFIKAVLAQGHYSSEKEISEDIDKFNIRLSSYNFINHSATEYGYARLDAFGRIYNRTLENLLTRSQLEEVLLDKMDKKEVDKALEGVSEFMTSDERDLVMQRLETSSHLAELKRDLFINADAPVSYPFLWDISYHDYVQWNGIGANAGLGALGRNTGEVIGVFGSLDWHEGKAWSLSSLLAGNGLKQDVVKFDSSVDQENLTRIEKHLDSLWSPKWEEAKLDDAFILPKLDKQLMPLGKQMFDLHCAECHAEIVRTSDKRRVVAFMSNVEETGTDPVMADNSINYSGYSGILRNQYVGAGVGNILLNQKAPIAALLTKATAGVVESPDKDKSFLTRWAEWLINIVNTYFSNEIKSSNKAGTYVPDTTNNPYASLHAYKGRSLNGIWATAPYLHNGSVPTLYDLLLPAQCPADQKDAECRPATFKVGSREFDPEKVGFKTDEGFTFDTTLKGNHNTGHEYGTAPRMTKDGRTLEPLSKDQRRALLEYLKSL